MKKMETIQNYLETIYIISLNNESVHAIDIANYLNYSRPTVSVSLKQLEKDGYITFKGLEIELSETGKQIALNMYERHEFIAQLLIKLGVDKKTAYEDSCLIEHDISETTFNAIKRSIEASKNKK